MILRSFIIWFIGLTFMPLFVNAQVVEDEDDFSVPPPYFNVALSSNGATAVASSFSNSPPYVQPPHGAINGDRKGLNWWSGEGGWADNTPGIYPDWLEIRFENQKLINEVDVFTLQDDNVNPAEPDPDMTFSLYGVVDFSLQYWTGSQWLTVSSVVNNNKIWTKFLFPAVSTDKIRIFITRAKWQSRIVEVEAWGKDALQAAPLPSGNIGGCAAAGLGPCELTYTLFEAISKTDNDVFHYRFLGNWVGALNWTFSKWKTTSSENIPPLAHAIALWVENPTVYGEANKTRAATWWKTFLDCQNGDMACSPDQPHNLRVFKGVELLSLEYDTTTTIAVLAARQWAVENNNRDLAVKAGLYLRNTWILYTLAAGQNHSLQIVNRFNANETPDRQRCQRDNEPPFLALAGMRSPYYDLCGDNVDTDQRTFLFGRALQLGPFNTTRQSVVNKTILDHIETRSQGNLLPGESAYGLVDWHRSLLRRVITPPSIAQLNSDISTLIQFIGPIRTKVNYHFLGLVDPSQGQIRLTLMESNPNPNTAPIMSVLYNSRTRSGRFLYPYSNKERTVPCIIDGVETTIVVSRPHRQGIGISAYGEFLPNTTPQLIEVSNEERGTRGGRNLCIHEDGRRIVEQMSVPGTVLYHILLSPNDRPQPVN